MEKHIGQTFDKMIEKPAPKEWSLDQVSPIPVEPKYPRENQNQETVLHLKLLLV